MNGSLTIEMLQMSTKRCPDCTQIQDQLFRYIRPDAQEEISSNFTRFLNNPANRDIRPTCIHGDFGTANILWSPEKGRMTGIIDFGGSGIGDPAYDLAGILAGYGQVFSKSVSPCIRMETPSRSAFIL